MNFTFKSAPCGNGILLEEYAGTKKTASRWLSAEESESLRQALNNSMTETNAENATPKFKVGDNVETGTTLNHAEEIKSVDIENHKYTCIGGRIIYFEDQDLWRLVPKPHYDIANFKPFDKVLVRDGDMEYWNADLFSSYHDEFHCFRGSWEQCIPFNDKTKHLLGTTDMPSREFINW